MNKMSRRLQIQMALELERPEYGHRALTAEEVNEFMMEGILYNIESIEDQAMYYARQGHAYYDPLTTTWTYTVFEGQNDTTRVQFDIVFKSPNAKKRFIASVSYFAFLLVLEDLPRYVQNVRIRGSVVQGILLSAPHLKLVLQGHYTYDPQTGLSRKLLESRT